MSDVMEKAADEKFCSSCGAIIKKEAEICPKCGVRQMTPAAPSPTPIFNKKYCSSCGELILKNAEICPKCGVRQQNKIDSEVSAEWLTLFLLSLFLGELGVDRFYVGKIGTGILKLITAGGCGIWWLVDWIMIACGKFTDSKGNIIKRE
jgi:TM2 domain-containing membrane protein YozV/predicted RNA-binding Zn-ribbon protein involved in translation (DUF1610 family)